MTALHPGLVFFATQLHPLTLDLFSYLWALWACLAHTAAVWESFSEAKR